MEALGVHRVVDAAHRQVGLLLAERTVGALGPLYDILLCPSNGISAVVDVNGLEAAARDAHRPRGRWGRPSSRLELLEAAEERFGTGLEEEELLFLLAYQGGADIPYRGALTALLATPTDIGKKGDVLVLKAPWRDFLVEASQDLPPGITGLFTAGLVEGWSVSHFGPNPVSRFPILAPALVEVVCPGFPGVQEGDHVLVRGALTETSTRDETTAPWRMHADELIVPARKMHFTARPAPTD
ncbi:MAG TPA: hypothetical protein VNZ52_07780 [Candidatus Thermoplasmatota archaeon]|nr:hypothetical protein [Candidatus Thermoplasmatota archaeon]